MQNLLDPRGIRNNNPGNIRLSATLWQGQTVPPQQDLDFVEFATPLYGLRALMKTLLTYYLKYNLDTVQSLINRYAPPYENATDAYIYQVAKALNVKRTDKIDVSSKQILTTLTQAIIMHENGPPPAGRPSGWYDPALYDQAAALAMPVTV
jgi:hypothetical protein